jgi:putative ABC transport system permease protein
MSNDLRYAIRTLSRSRGFTIVAMLTLALGIGANTAVFSAVDAVLIHPLVYRHSEELVSVAKDMPMFGLSDSVASSLDFVDYRSSSKSFAAMAAIERNNFNLTGSRDPQRIPGMRVSPGLFGMLGVTPFLGRAFTPEEEQWGRHRVAILSESLWRSRFGSNPRIAGEQVEIEGEAYTIVGVVHPMLQFLSRSEIWMPLAFSPDQLLPHARGHQFLNVIARLKLGVTLAQANADLSVAAAAMTKRLPDWYPKGWSIHATPLANVVSGPSRTPLLILLGAVALVLLIGCANVANLMLARAAARQREISIRSALGAGRMRIVRQLLFESGVLSILAGSIGLLLAAWGMEAFSRFGPSDLLRGQHLDISPLVAGFTMLLSLATVVLFGLVPALSASRVDLNDALKSSERAGTGSVHKRRLRQWLVGAEVALSLVLLISAGLLIRSFIRIEQASPGFSPDRVLTAHLSLSAVDYKTRESQLIFYGQLLQRLSSLPGVVRASAINNLPLSGSNRGGSFDIIGHPWAPNQNVPDVDQRSAMPGYFDALGIPLLRGRVFDERDGWNAPKVAVVDEPFARQFFAGDPIGKRINGPSPDGKDKGVYTIVGVVGGIKHHSLSTAPAPTIYYPQLQAPLPAMAIVIQAAAADPLSLTAALRAEVARMNPDLPLFRVATLDHVMEDSLARTRFTTALLGAFALIALLLAAIGTFGVVSYAVGRRTREIGIRMALGARSADAVALVLSQGMRPVFAGIGAGLAVSFAVTRALSSQLYGITAADPLTFTVVAFVLALVAAAAAYLPARRAARVDPMTALRDE